jgi:hypothetical protein
VKITPAIWHQKIQGWLFLDLPFVGAILRLGSRPAWRWHGESAASSTSHIPLEAIAKIVCDRLGAA